MTKSAETTKAFALVTQALEWAYENAAAAGVILAESHLKSCGGDREKAIDDLIGWNVAYAGAIGFSSNLGGLITMPVTLPANLTAVLYIQLRVIAAISHLRGYDIKDEKVKTLAFICLTGSSAATILQDFGVGLGTKLSTRLLAQISGATLININKAVGFRLITKAGSTGLVNLTRWVPVVGGVVGGMFDAAVTRGIGAASKEVFTPVDDDLSDPIIPPEG